MCCECNEATEKEKHFKITKKSYFEIYFKVLIEKREKIDGELL